MRLPTLDAWNLTIQRQITPTMSAEIAYVGNKGTHVFIGNGPSYNLNTPTIVGFNEIRIPIYSLHSIKVSKLGL